MIILAADPSQPHFKAQLPENIIYMTKDDVLTNEVTLLDVFSGTLPENTDLYEWNEDKKKFFALMDVFQGEQKTKAEGTTNKGLATLFKALNLNNKIDDFPPETADTFLDPDYSYFSFGPMPTTSKPQQGVLIEPWGQCGGRVEKTIFVPVYPVGNKLKPVLDFQHFPYAERSFYRLKWVRGKKVSHVFATTHVSVLTPEVLSKPLVVVDISPRQRQQEKNPDSIELWLHQFAEQLEDKEATILVTGGKPANTAHVRACLGSRTAVYYPDPDDTKYEYLKTVIKKFSGEKRIYRRFSENTTFNEPELGLKETELVTPVPTAPTKDSLNQSKGRMTDIDPISVMPLVDN